MRRRQDGVQIRVDWYTRFCLTAITVLLTVLIVALWAERMPGARDAHAAREAFVLDSSGQRATMIKELKKGNAKLEELVSLLRSGQVKVQVAAADGGKAGGGNVPTPKSRKSPR